MQIPLTMYMHSCAICAVCDSTCQHSFWACLSLQIKHLQLSQTLFRGLSGRCGLCHDALLQHKQAHHTIECCFCSAAASNQLAKQKGGGCSNRQQADTNCNCNAKLQLPTRLNEIIVHDLLCTALQDQLAVFASAYLLQLWHAAVRVVNHWPHNSLKASRSAAVP